MLPRRTKCVCGQTELKKKKSSLNHNHNHDHTTDLRSARSHLAISWINIKRLQRSDLRSAWNGGSGLLIFSCNYDGHPTNQWGREGSTCGAELKGGDEGVARTELPQIANNQNKRQSGWTTHSKKHFTTLSPSPSNRLASTSSSSSSIMDFLFCLFFTLLREPKQESCV